MVDGRTFAIRGVENFTGLFLTQSLPGEKMIGPTATDHRNGNRKRDGFSHMP